MKSLAALAAALLLAACASQPAAPSAPSSKLPSPKLPPRSLGMDHLQKKAQFCRTCEGREATRMAACESFFERYSAMEAGLRPRANGLESRRNQNFYSCQLDIQHTPIDLQPEATIPQE